MTNLDQKSFINVPTGKLPHFDGINFAKWKHLMRAYLIGLHPGIWDVFCNRFEPPVDPKNPTLDEMRIIHLNDQATSMFLSALDGDEYNRVIGVDVSKQIWDTLHIALEGVDKVRKARIDLSMAKPNRFVIMDGEGPQEMFDRLMTMVGKIRGYGCDKVDDHKVVKIMLEAYSPRNKTVVTLIRDKKKFEYFTPNDILGRILTFDMQREEANERKRFGELQAKLNGIKIKDCPYEIKDNKYKKDKKEDKTDHRKRKKYMEEAHIGHEWDSTRESTSEEDEKVATIAIHKSSTIPRLFNNMSDNDYYSPHICLMAKGEKMASGGEDDWRGKRKMTEV
ncbi:uncharacterized protein [Miscanthus floridulus]|uniref:uncharacterized protein n=1 Tax=Miscanthus floridulus TaxID=154761 RepID=UPI0034598147